MMSDNNIESDKLSEYEKAHREGYALAASDALRKLRSWRNSLTGVAVISSLVMCVVMLLVWPEVASYMVIPIVLGGVMAFIPNVILRDVKKELHHQ